MKLYIQDSGYRGSIIAFANSEEEAREMMSGEFNYDATTPLREEEIKHGFVFSNLGDC